MLLWAFKFRESMVVSMKEQVIEKIASGEDFVARFTADWCMPCKQMAPVVKDLKSEGIDIVDINIDDNRFLCEQFDVMSVPTFIRFVGGKPVAKTQGAKTKEVLKKDLLLTN